MATTLEPSILKTIKKLLGLGDDYIHFDTDIIVHINTVFSNLTQMGIGPITSTSQTVTDPDTGETSEVQVSVVGSFIIDGADETWENFFTGHEDPNLIQQVKTYTYIKVKLLFDPPSNGNLLKALNENAKELEVRLYTQVGGY